MLYVHLYRIICIQIKFILFSLISLFLDQLKTNVQLQKPSKKCFRWTCVFFCECTTYPIGCIFSPKIGHGQTREQNTFQLKFKKENIHTIFSVDLSKNNMKLISCYTDLKRFQFLIEHVYQPGNEIQKWKIFVFSLSHRKESSEDKLSACLLADPLSTDFDQRTAHVQKSRRKA